MKVKTSDLTGPALDWAVAKCEGDMIPDGGVMIQTWPYYSSDWSQGGAILERERIWLNPEIGKEGTAGSWFAVAANAASAYGPTHLIAAMRCYVASKVGDEVEIPEQLLTTS